MWANVWRSGSCAWVFMFGVSLPVASPSPRLFPSLVSPLPCLSSLRISSLPYVRRRVHACACVQARVCAYVLVVACVRWRGAEIRIIHMPCSWDGGACMRVCACACVMLVHVWCVVVSACCSVDVLCCVVLCMRAA